MRVAVCCREGRRCSALGDMEERKWERKRKKAVVRRNMCPPSGRTLKVEAALHTQGRYNRRSQVEGGGLECKSTGQIGELHYGVVG